MERRAGEILRGHLDRDVGRADLLQALRNGALRNLGRVAVAAEVAEIKRA